MPWSPYTFDDAVELIVEDGDVYITIEGAESYPSGDYMNERNRTVKVEVPKEQVLAAAEAIR